MYTVGLSGVRFHAPVGVYPQEALTFNELELNMTVSCDAGLEELPFMDYAVLYQIAKNAVSTPTLLLEEIIKKISGEILKEYAEAKIRIEIRKLNPPLGGDVAAALVSWETP